MQAGVPVVARRAGALPEVLGDAAYWYEGDDLAGAAARVRELLLDPARRREQAARGHAQAARYTWQSAAAQIAEHIRAVVR